MADAMVQKDKKGEKITEKKVAQTEEELLRMDDSDFSLFDKPRETKTRSKSSKSSSKPSTSGMSGAGSSGKPPPTKSACESEMLNILKEIRTEQTKTNERVETMNKRIDALYDDDYDYEDNNEDYCQDDEDDACDDVQADENTNSGEPPSKKQKSSENEETRFTSMGKKFRSGEKCASPINEQLASNITDIFRNGISQERFSDLMKDEKLTRPDNCDGLVTVQTDQVIWDILYPETKTNDNKMKSIQSVVVKSSTVMAKVIDKLDKLLIKDDNAVYSSVLDDCMDALALMGHANRQICLMRRTLMKYDIITDYGHLLTTNLSFDKNLFGGDVAKTVEDIGKCSRISNKIRGHGGRGGFRGRRPWWKFGGRGRGRGTGLGRGRGSARPDKPEPKNSRWNHNKYRY